MADAVVGFEHGISLAKGVAEPGANQCIAWQTGGRAAAPAGVDPQTFETGRDRPSFPRFPTPLPAPPSRH
jgi:hypothetical protein